MEPEQRGSSSPLFQDSEVRLSSSAQNSLLPLVLPHSRTGQGQLDPPPLHHKVDDDAHRHDGQLDPDEEPVLSIEQHHRPEGPGKQLTECGKDTGKRCVIESQGLILRVYDPQKDEPMANTPVEYPNTKTQHAQTSLPIVHGRARK